MNYAFQIEIKYVSQTGVVNSGYIKIHSSESQELKLDTIKWFDGIERIKVVDPMEFPNCIFSIYNDEYQEIFNNIKDSIRSIKEQNNLQKLSDRINDVVLDRLVELYQKFNLVSNQYPLYKVQEKCMDGFEITTTLFELDDSNNVIGQPYLSYWQGKSGI